MDMRIVGVGTLVIGVGVGAGLWWFGDRGSRSPIGLDAQYALSQQSEPAKPGFDSSEFDEPTEREISTSNTNNAQSGGGFGPGGFFSRMSEFDLDGDGSLSEEERQQMRQTMRAAMLERFDLDGDGELSREERQAARMARFENSNRGQALMREFDLDGDGVLDAEEQAAMDAAVEEQRQARRDEMMARYDLDGDGDLSEEERQLQREDRQSQREEFMQGMTEEFDADGDGELNIDEQQRAFEVMRERRAIDRFLEQFDVDGDGVMGAADYESFAELYGNGDMAADVNHDGIVNTEDLLAYRDMVTQSDNRP